jgi:hypothetical protein
MSDERPIRPAGEALLRVFAGEDIVDRAVGHDSVGSGEDDHHIFGVQALEDALLGVNRSPENDSDGELGLHGMDAEALINRAVFDDQSECGLSHSELQALSLYKLADSASESAQRDCSICLSALEAGQEACALDCLHVFHHTCALRWLRHHTSCPYCRTEVRVLEQGDSKSDAANGEARSLDRSPL